MIDYSDKLLKPLAPTAKQTKDKIIHNKSYANPDATIVNIKKEDEMKTPIYSNKEPNSISAQSWEEPVRHSISEPKIGNIQLFDTVQPLRQVQQPVLSKLEYFVLAIYKERGSGANTKSQNIRIMKEVIKEAKQLIELCKE